MVLAWGMAVLALICSPTPAAELPEPRGVSHRKRALATLGLFSNLALVYLVISVPLATHAWTGYVRINPAGLASTVPALYIVFALVKRDSLYRISKSTSFTLNALLVGCLVGALLAAKPGIPAGSEPVHVFDGLILSPILLFGALLLSFMVIVNVHNLVREPLWNRPRTGVPFLVMGMAFLISMAYLLLLTNVWGYVPFGSLFRLKFYAPFVIIGLGILTASLRFHSRSDQTAAPYEKGDWIRLLLIFILVVHSLWGLIPSPKSVSNDKITVMTYNMQQGSHVSGKRNYRQQLEFLRSINPDIIGLQECDTPRPSAGFVDSVRYFAEQLGYHAYYGPNTTAGTYGTAILSRYPISNPRTFYTFSDVDEVGSAVAEVKIKGETILFFSNHPAGSDRVMNDFVDAVMAESGKHKHVIAVGDYNFTAREPYYAKLSSAIRDSAEKLGEDKVNKYGSGKNLADQIDHIFISDSIEVLESHYLEPPKSETDHPAHWSVLRMRP